jgi:hypothetical protein
MDGALAAISGKRCETGVASGGLVLDFADAILNGGSNRLAKVRDQLIDVLGARGLVECAAVAANFSQMVRIADSTGIPLDAPMLAMAEPLRDILNIEHFHSAENTIVKKT